ncbi:hypothetical protein [Winogradskyella sp. UBA3174]|uniref:hypothetical protein n=1 Tax=Winogradskyella sp. UBA3174 TaxID=1947785 RepID=UPI0025DC501F|nr:hypothetical protein [Winogradskyella sp. UBA3174]|tara:strand:+ start:38259 stop:39572 length:1314 start_codon:yes stop_codon:yes gene_type:complete
MKNLKFTLFSLFMALMVFTSCTNEEAVIDEQQTTEESASITKSLNELSQQFNQTGNFTTTNNPAGNIVFDFCFDFVYPLTLSYNNGSTVTVDGLGGLVNIILGSNENLFINGIAFPFDVETYSENSNTIEIVTINNEDEFVSLVENCGFDDIEVCECFEVFDPVCVEITDPNGEIFTVTYPNACYAECDGFTENDFVDTCEDDYYSGSTECFTLNYPLSIIINGDTVLINSQEELGNSLYDVYDFDFVYPFTVTLDNEEVITINTPEDIETILEDCYGDIDGGGECEECENTPVDLVCIQYTNEAGETVIEVFTNMCYAICEGFTENNVVNCEDDNNPSDCSEDAVASALVECQIWFATVNNQVYTYVFSSDGTVTVSLNNSAVTSGTWSLTNVNGTLTAIIIMDSENFSDEWSFYCDTPILIVVSSTFWNIESGCD